MIPFWPNGTPGFESRKDIPEQAASFWVKNINNPSLIIFLPRRKKRTARRPSSVPVPVFGNARNEAQRQPALNLHLACAYLTASDPAFVERT